MKGLDFIIEKIKGNRVLVSNFSYLSILQVVNLIIPLVTYPYLIRVLGSELYGLVIFTQVVAGYFNIFISFGFTMYGAKEVSIYRDDKDKLSEIVSTISLIKFLFFGVSLVILSIFFIIKPNEYQILYILGLWVCLSEILFPSWFFQGIEEMKFITLISLCSKIILLILIFCLIKDEDDVLWLPGINFISVFISGIVSYYIIRQRGIYLKNPSYMMIKNYLKNSCDFFLQSATTAIYVNTNRFFIGVFLGMKLMAYYDLAEKIVGFVRIPQSIISQVCYPKISLTRDIKFIKKILKLSIIINVTFYIFFILFLGKFIIPILGGEDMFNSISILKIIGIAIPLSAISNVLGDLTLATLGYSRLFIKTALIGFVSYFIIFFLYYVFFEIRSSASFAIIYVLAEFVKAFSCVYFLSKNKILFFKL